MHSKYYLIFRNMDFGLQNFFYQTFFTSSILFRNIFLYISALRIMFRIVILKSHPICTLERMLQGIRTRRAWRAPNNRKTVCYTCCCRQPQTVRASFVYSNRMALTLDVCAHERMRGGEAVCAPPARIYLTSSNHLHDCIRRRLRPFAFYFSSFIDEHWLAGWSIVCVQPPQQLPPPPPPTPSNNNKVLDLICTAILCSLEHACQPVPFEP